MSSIRAVNVKEHERFRGVYWIEFEDGSTRLATRNLTPGRGFMVNSWLTLGVLSIGCGIPIGLSLGPL